MKAIILSACLGAAPLLAAPVPLPPGETPLTDIGVYQVYWQSYGKQAVAMPDSWAGHFDTATGISFQPWGMVSGRSALLMHSPWHVLPGKVWVAYTLQLPKLTPIQLSFGIAMGPDVAAPDKSDGVTFSSAVIAAGKTNEWMRQHYDKAEWRDYSLDLSAHAGQTIQLRLTVEPGPKNSPSFDYSFFGNAKIAVGTASQTGRETAVQIIKTTAYQATAKTSLETVANQNQQGVTPGNLLPFKNSLTEARDAWRFSYEGRDARIVFTYQPASGTLDDFTAQVDDHPGFQPCLDAGVSVMEGTGPQQKERRLTGGKPAKIQRQGNTLLVDWDYDHAGKPLRVRWSFRLAGKALVIGAQCAEPVVSRFSLGNVGGAPLRRTFTVPYLAGNLHYLAAQNAYVSRYLNWTASHASRSPQGGAVYEVKTDGTRNALQEAGYVAVSPSVAEVLPNLPNPPSPFLAQLGPRIMLDIWGHHKGTYAGDAENLRNLKDLGVDHVAIIQHVWQRFGYDVKLPDHIPADPRYGGEEGMKLFGQAANESGYIWSLHENYIDLYPDAPSYDPTARVLKADGSPSPAWYNQGTKVQSFGLKCNRALDFAKQNAPEIHKRYGTTAAYLDVHSCVPPWHQLDHEANQPMAAMALAKVKNDTALFQYMRDTHQGPLFGEGNNHFYWAGLCDGTEAQVQGGEDHQPFLDFDLLKIHPQMVNHGMGYYERWFRGAYKHQLGIETGTMEQIDKYRAMELAYGHAGFVGSPHDHNWHWVVREHHLMHPVQRLYGTAKPVEILYEVAGQLVTASAALPAGDTWRQRIRYNSGLTLWVNWKPEPWTVEGRTLPQWGFLAQGPGTEVATALRGGKISDYAECPEFIFADARTYAYMPYRRGPRQIEPRLKAFEHLGGARVRVTYEWIVGEDLDDNYNCFVHGTHPSSDGPDQIVWQQDHSLPKPTKQWRKGDVITDGPHEFSVSDKQTEYDLTIGLFKGDRLRLKGIRDDSGRIVLAKLKLTKTGDQIAKITAEKPTAKAGNNITKEADFTAHLNSEGTWIDFGKVATDGSIKINKGTDGLVIFPYPRDKQFRVSLDLKAIAPQADLKRLKLTALGAGDQQPLGVVPFQLENGRVTLNVGTPGAGRYGLGWK